MERSGIVESKADVVSAEPEQAEAQCERENILIKQQTATNSKQQCRDNYTHKCPKCDKKFANRPNLRQHMLCHIKELPHKCTICDKGFKTTTLLKYHSRIHTGDMLKCEVCGKEFTRTAMWNRHMAEHREALNTCKICGSKYTHKPRLRKHMAQIHGITEIDDDDYNSEQMTNTNEIDELASKSEEQIPISQTHGGENAEVGDTKWCSICNKHVANLNRHSGVHSGERPFECDHCGVAFTYYRNLRRHYLLHSEERQHKCEICGKSYVTAMSLRYHSRIHTGTRDFPGPNPDAAEKLHPCTQCDKIFKTSYNLRRHFSSHKGDLAYECNICNKTFVTATLLENHLRIHTGDLFKCEVCGREFNNIDNWMRHMATHSDTAHTCNVCGKILSDKYTLERHFARFHPLQKKERCTICTKEVYNLKHHEAAHKSLYKCDQCDRAFTFRKSLKRHLLLHDAYLRHKCEICDKSYATADSLRYHFMTHIDNPIREGTTSKSSELPPEISSESTIYVDENGSLMNMIRGELDAEQTVKVENQDVNLEDIIHLTDVSDRGVEFEIAAYNDDTVGEDGPQHESERNAFNDSRAGIIENEMVHEEQQIVKLEEQELIVEENVSMVTDPEGTVDDMTGVGENNKPRSKRNRKNKLNPPTCGQCSLTFVNNYSLRRHISTKHINKTTRRRPEDIYECDKCDRALSTRASFKRHYLTHDIVRPYACEICDKSYTTAWTLKNHLQSHMVNQEQEGSYELEATDVEPLQSTNDVDDNVPLVHMIKKEIVSEETYYAQTAQLEQEELNVEDIHVADIEYKSDTYADGITIGQFMIVNDEGNREQTNANSVDKRVGENEHDNRPGHIEGIDEEAATSFILQRHFLGVHINRKADKRERSILRPYKCDQCDRTFTRKFSVKRHIEVVHSDSRDHKCTICGHTFTAAPDLQSHFLAHIENREEVSRYERKATDVEPSKRTTMVVSENVSLVDVIKNEIVLEENNGDNSYKNTEDTTTVNDDDNAEPTNAQDINKTVGVYQLGHECSQCDKTFASPFTLRRHRLLLHGSRATNYTCRHASTLISSTCAQCPYRCDQCGRAFDLRRSLRRHYFLHFAKLLYQCKICNKSHTSAAALRLHNWSHAGYQGKRRGRPRHVDRDKFNSKLHSNIIFERDSKCPYKCGRCNKSFAHYSSVKRHLSLYCPLREHKCTICGQSFTTASFLKVHFLSHTENQDQVGDDEREATDVNESVPLVDIIKNEIVSEENYCAQSVQVANEESNIEVDIRDNCYKNAEDTTTGQTTIVNDDGNAEPTNANDIDETLKDYEREHKCSECDKTFASSFTLRRHRLLLHGGKTNYTCRHAATLGSGTCDQCPYRCDQCGRAFALRNSLRGHYSRHFTKRLHQCKKCNTSYRSSTALRLHIRSHAGKGKRRRIDLHSNITVDYDSKYPYKCDKCNKSFTHYSSVKRHLSLYCIFRDQKCTICGQNYTTASSLKLHFLSHTENQDQVGSDEREATDFEPSQSTTNDADENVPLVDIIKNEIPSGKNYYAQSVQVANQDSNVEAVTTLFRQRRNFSVDVSKTVLRCKHVTTLTFGTCDQCPHKCDQCGKAFAAGSSLRSHYLHHYSNRKHQCDICDKKHTSARALRLHIRSHYVHRYRRKKRTYNCDKCGKIFTRRANVKRHLLLYCNSRYHKCTNCDKSFISASSLELHFRSHVENQQQDGNDVGQSESTTIGEVEKVALDDMIGKENVAEEYYSGQSVQPSNLELDRKDIFVADIKDENDKNEEGTTTGQIMIVNNKGNTKPTNANDTYEIVGKYVQDNGVKGSNFTCSKCDQHFISMYSLRRHHLLLHGNSTAYKCRHVASLAFGTCAQCPYKCDQCGRAFELRNSLRSHYYRHFAKRPHQCKICDKSHTSASALRLHFESHAVQRKRRGRPTRTKNAIKPTHKCDQCGKAFTRRESVKRHLLLHCSARDHESLKLRLQSYMGNQQQEEREATVVEPSVSTTIEKEEIYCAQTVQPSNAELDIKDIHVAEDTDEHEVTVVEPSKITTIEKEIVAEGYCCAQTVQPTKTELDMKDVHVVEDTDERGATVVEPSESNSIEKEIVAEEIYCAQTVQPSNAELNIQDFHVTKDTDERKAAVVEPSESTTIEKKIVAEEYYCAQTVQVTNAELDIKDIHVVDKNAEDTTTGQILIINDEEPEHTQNNDGRPSLKCLKCDKLFVSTFNLRRHHLLLHESKPFYRCRHALGTCDRCPYKCDQCDRAFASHTSLEYHYSRHSRTQGLHRCEICDKNHMSVSALRLHLRTHVIQPKRRARDGDKSNVKRERPKCPKCDIAFTRRESVKRHLKLHCDSRDLKCTICDKSFITESSLDLHYYRSHPEDQEQEGSYERVATDVEPSESATIGNGKNVPLADMIEKEIVAEEYYCTQTQQFSNAELGIKDIHAADIEDKSDKNTEGGQIMMVTEKTDKNEKVTTTGQIMIVNNEGNTKPTNENDTDRTVRGGKRVLKCFECDKTFASAYTLNRHRLLLHESRTNYTCRHVPATAFGHCDQCPYKCDQCGRAFALCSSLKNHYLCHFTKERHQCEICDKSHSSASDLRVHFRSHDVQRKRVGRPKRIDRDTSSGELHSNDSNIIFEQGSERPYKCNYCNKSFTRRTSVQRHLLLHCDARDRKCTICDRSFMSATSLRLHLRSHSGNQQQEDGDELEATDVEPSESSISEKADDPHVDIIQREIVAEEYPYEQNVQPANEELDIKDEKNKTAEDMTTGQLTNSNSTIQYEQDNSGEGEGFKCLTCGNTFVSTDTLRQHHLMVHGSEISYNCMHVNPATFGTCDQCPYKCDQCGRAFPLRSSLKTHYSTHFTEIRHQCEICDERHTSAAALKLHFLSHAIHQRRKGRPRNNYKCTKCTRTFASKKGLRHHLFTFHINERNSVQRSYKCDQCDEAFTQHQTLLRHYSRSHTDNPKKCDICHKEFNLLSELKSHLTTHGGNLLICNTCGKTFSKHHALQKHLAFYHSIKTKRPRKQCNICNQFVTNLSSHLATHSGEQPHVCGVCGKKFTFHQSLRRHSLLHLSERPHKCEICGKGFITVTGLKYHFRIHTGEQLTCDICGRGLATASDLKRHMATHEAPKFDCKVCYIKFRTSYGVLAHTCRGTQTSRNESTIATSECSRDTVEGITLDEGVTDQQVIPAGSESRPEEIGSLKPNENVVNNVFKTL
ncbi:uncharacterized protein LOC129727605 [Wyeomyia smithii]|uniref:uncharacterized protein LOC129727605 n=1 Tax=Wyeomyia smithii TaxID=174621 RepID=UPI0024682181|nr:uncharacterized protein LOC129727605 [Wyeomyia smithii]XP_055541566.1 uncharacterized protein LOC129727605 [Wyeomyia smithii]XP_055541567.1 uncharacterized protein LOC129727605 [Wyeomyia smithii]XP_055541568.1 uncharacterized protein LOC129727605 [Wyeomyia smithii]